MYMYVCLSVCLSVCLCMYLAGRVFNDVTFLWRKGFYMHSTCNLHAVGVKTNGIIPKQLQVLTRWFGFSIVCSYVIILDRVSQHDRGLFR